MCPKYNKPLKKIPIIYGLVQYQQGDELDKKKLRRFGQGGCRVGVYGKHLFICLVDEEEWYIMLRDKLLPYPEPDILKYLKKEN